MGGVLGRESVIFHVSCLCRSGGGAPVLCASYMSADLLQCDCGNEGIPLGGFDEASLDAFLSQPSPCYGKETQVATSSLLGLRFDVL